MQRFDRTIRLIGTDFETLRNARITVVGLGAVGSYAVEALARIGIGSFRLIDFDKVELSNINRQLYAMESTLAQPKTKIAMSRILDICPDTKVEILNLFVRDENVNEILSNSPDIVVDAIDSIGSKVSLLEHCYRQGIPVVSSMGAALRKDPSKIKTGDLMQTQYCPLARRIRRILKKRGISKGIQCVYSDEKVKLHTQSNENEQSHRILGSLPTLTGIFGLNLAHLTMQSLLKQHK